MSKTHNAGIVTAYGAAVRGGYTGTYEEFCAQQAQYAENARQMEQAVSDVRQIKTSVESAVSEAEGYANNANQSATNASNSATQASESASNANQSANNASSSADSASQSASSAQTSANNASTSEQNAHQSAEDAQDILESVQTEGDTQIGRIQAKGQEVLDSLPEDFTQVQKDIASLNGSLGDVKADLSEINASQNEAIYINSIVTQKNIFPDTVNATDGYYKSYVTGRIVAMEIYSYTDIFPIKPYGYETEEQYVLSADASITSYQIFICFYDSNLEFKHGVVVSKNSNTFTIPVETEYMCISYRTDCKGKLQIEKGSEPSEFCKNDTSYELFKKVINKISYNIEKSNFGLDYKNVFTAGITTDGKYRSAANGHEVECSSYFYSDYFPIDSNATYAFSLNPEDALETTTFSAFICLYDISKKFVSGAILDNNNYTFATDEKCAYCIVSTRIIFKNSIQIEKNSSISYYEKPHAVIHSDKQIITNNIGPTFYVEKNGTGDFKSLTRAIDAAEKYMDSVVYVGPGTYDLIEELTDFYGSDYFNNIDEASSQKQGIQLKNRIHLIFSSRSLVTAKYTGDNIYVMSKFSAFNASTYGFTLENMRLETSNTRYCIHDERSTATDAYKNVYKNCSMKQDNSSNIGWASKACIGGGLGTNAEIVVENSIFESVRAESVPRAKYLVSYHNSSDLGNVGARSNVVITGNYIKGGCSINCSWYGNSHEITTFVVTNNSVGADIRIHPEGDDSTLFDNIEVYEWNNVIRST